MFKAILWIILAAGLSLLLTACSPEGTAPVSTLKPHGTGAPQTLLEDSLTNTEEATTTLATETAIVMPTITTPEPTTVTEEALIATATSQLEDFEIVKDDCGWKIT